MEMNGTSLPVSWFNLVFQSLDEFLVAEMLLSHYHIKGEHDHS